MARRKNFIDIDFTTFTRYAEQLEKFGADLQMTMQEAMEKTGKTVAEDTEAAMAASNLPAHGKYSTGETADSIIKDPKVEWSGNLGTMRLGFDFGKPGAGGFLITGTPKMPPNQKLAQMYTGRKYERDLVKGIEDNLEKELEKIRG